MVDGSQLKMLKQISASKLACCVFMGLSFVPSRLAVLFTDSFVDSAVLAVFVSQLRMLKVRKGLLCQPALYQPSPTAMNMHRELFCQPGFWPQHGA
jgi:hypothetical protein